MMNKFMKKFAAVLTVATMSLTATSAFVSTSNGGTKYNIGDHVEVESWFGCTHGGRITDIKEDGGTCYEVNFDDWYVPTEWFEEASIVG